MGSTNEVPTRGVPRDSAPEENSKFRITKVEKPSPEPSPGARKEKNQRNCKIRPDGLGNPLERKSLFSERGLLESTDYGN